MTADDDGKLAELMAELDEVMAKRAKAERAEAEGVAADDEAPREVREEARRYLAECARAERAARAAADDAAAEYDPDGGGGAGGASA